MWIVILAIRIGNNSGNGPTDTPSNSSNGNSYEMVPLLPMVADRVAMVQDHLLVADQAILALLQDLERTAVVHLAPDHRMEVV